MRSLSTVEPAGHTVSAATDVRSFPARRAALGAVGLGGAIAAVQVGGTDTGPGLCVIRACTGGWCPGCGGARAAHHLLHGELSASWADHPWVVLAAAQVLVIAVVALVVWVGRSFAGSAVPIAGPPGRMRLGAGVVLAGNLALLLAIWLVRVGTGSIPSPW